MNKDSAAAPSKAAGPAASIPADPAARKLLLDDALKFVQASDARPRLEQSLDKLLEEGKQAMLQRNPGLDPKFGDEWVKRMRERIKPDDFVEITAKVYATYYTSDELEQMTQAQLALKNSKIYSLSPELSQKIKPNGPKIQHDINTDISRLGSSMSIEVGQEIRRKNILNGPSRSRPALLRRLQFLRQKSNCSRPGLGVHLHHESQGSPWFGWTGYPCYSCGHMETAAIQTHGLTRRFGALTAVDDVTFSVAPGQFFGFLGPNGAGKSTTIKMLTGLLEPSAGSIEILGQPFSAGALDLKRQIGVVPEGMALLGRLTAPEYLRFVGRMYGLDRETTQPAHGRAAGVHAAGQREPQAGDRFFPRHAEEAGAGRGRDSRAQGAVSR